MHIMRSLIYLSLSSPPGMTRLWPCWSFCWRRTTVPTSPSTIPWSRRRMMIWPICFTMTYHACTLMHIRAPLTDAHLMVKKKRRAWVLEKKILCAVISVVSAILGYNSCSIHLEMKTCWQAGKKKIFKGVILCMWKAWNSFSGLVWWSLYCLSNSPDSSQWRRRTTEACGVC